MTVANPNVSGTPEPMTCSTPTTNACKMCTPLGACLAFRGVEGGAPFLHGSQGCATYIRRYMISHFREPIDIASSAFSEQTVVFGGQSNFTEGLFNVIRQYQPALIGIATTCLAETIGDDLGMFTKEFLREYGDLDGLPILVPVSTPSYAGTHAEGFWHATEALVSTVAEQSSREDDLVGICPGMISPSDIRYLHDCARAFHLRYVLLPDYSETLGGGSWDDYMRIPAGGTPIRQIRKLGNASAFVNFSCCVPGERLPGASLKRQYGTRQVSSAMPIGVEATDRLFQFFGEMAGMSVPRRFKTERARLIDAYVDGHKITAGKRVAVFGDADFVVGMARFVREAGLNPVICAAGGKASGFEQIVRDHVEGISEEAIIRDQVDFSDIEADVKDADIDLLIGSSKGYAMSRRLNIPLLRACFPVHDRMGGARLRTLGYEGALSLFDQICNLLLEYRQSESPVGYTYM